MHCAISIHALREEGDDNAPTNTKQGNISIHALREEGDPVIFLKEKEISIFLSTPSARRATRMDQPITRAEHISIHALREEGDGCGLATQRSRTISIHALREEGDIWRCRVGRNTENFYPRPPRGGRPEKTTPAILSTRFLSTPSARRATKGRVSAPRDFLFLSTPSARRATLLALELVPAISHFYPRPPRGGRRLLRASVACFCDISIHALREEGDSLISGTTDVTEISIHALREEGDGFSRRCLKRPNKFLSTPSARRAT